MTRYFFESIGTNARQLDELPPMPWISSRTSPAPSSWYATRSPCNVIIFRFVMSAALSPFWLGWLPASHLDEASLAVRAWNFLNGVCSPIPQQTTRGRRRRLSRQGAARLGGGVKPLGHSVAAS